jgi:hypothetical protein
MNRSKRDSFYAEKRVTAGPIHDTTLKSKTFYVSYFERLVKEEIPVALLSNHTILISPIVGTSLKAK